MATTVGKAIRVIREATGMSLGSLAGNAQLSVPYLSLVENDKRSPSVDVLTRLAEALGLPANMLLVIASRSPVLANADPLTVRVVGMLDKLKSLESELEETIKEGQPGEGAAKSDG